MLSTNLPANEVHLYLVSFNKPGLTPNQLLPLLNEAERTQAARYITTALQERYIITHGLLRLLLGKYLQIAPEAVRFIFNEYKKPALANEHASTLRFNLSHSGDYVVFALANNIDLGIDIERIQDQPKMEVAERFFCREETSALRALPPAEQTQCFYRLWAKKEAIIKANGKGLAALLTSFSVNTSDQPEIILLEQQSWSLYTLNLAQNYAAALATSSPVNIAVLQL